MANNRLHGYTPKTAKGNVGVPYGDDLKFVNQNPHEFRKGMDYELTSLGCSRLQESTPEEREKATETVLKNLEGNGGYYTSLITYETLFRNEVEGIKKPSFTSWLKQQEEYKMKEVKSPWKTGKMKGPDHKNDKMTELKEAIKRRIKAKLSEQKDEEDVDDMGDKVVDKKGTTKSQAKGANIEKGMARFEDEKKAIDELLFGEAIPLSDKQRAKGEKEISKENPAEGSLLFRKDANLEIYKQDKDVANYKTLIKLEEKEIKALEAHIEDYGADGAGNNVTLDMVKGEDLPSTIKKLEARKTAIDKEVADETARVGEQRNEIAATNLTRENQLRLLEIIRANGVSLREGTDNIRHYYEIAKTAYLEGLGQGMGL